MNTIKLIVRVFLLLGIAPAIAQDVMPVMPTVPTVGISPMLNWALSLLTVVMTVTLPVGVAFLKQRLNIANTADRNAMIDRAVKRGALVTYGNQLAGATPAQAAADGLNYVKNAVPESIGAVSQATDKHLSNAIAAEVVGINQIAAPADAVLPVTATPIPLRPVT